MVRVRDLIHGLQARSRARKLELLRRLLRPSGTSSVLEVGVGDSEPFAATNYLVKNYSHPEAITALGLGSLAGFRARYPRIRAVGYDGKVFPFRSGSFDIAHANAVIEHLGSPAAQQLFLAEMFRVARSGMVTTPNRYFPIEVHTMLPLLHWLGKERFDRAVELIRPERIAAAFRRFGKEYPVGEHVMMRLLGAGELRALARRVGMRRHRVVRGRVAGLTMTLALVWWAA